MPSGNQWFEEWFNHPLYLDVYSHRDDGDARKLLDTVVPLTGLKPGASVLDLACGAGRHAILLSEKGFQVTGVDLADNLLSVAKKEAVARNQHIQWIRQDMRYLHLQQQFDGVFCLFTSFGYFEDDMENFSVIRMIADHLKPGGMFVFDYLNESWLRKSLIPKDERELAGSRLIQQRRIEGNRVIKSVQILRPDGDHLEFTEKVTLYPEDLLEKVFWNMGFTITHRLGTLDGEPWTPDTPRLILICRKQ